MSNLRTPEEIKSFLSNHCFENRYHAFAARAIIITKYGRSKEIKDLEYKYPVIPEVDMELPVITANDAINFLTKR